ncbi:MAG: DUF4286 family protein [Paludibacter sp.]|nr:DUF4286 family protein [Paludibacter sp.]
MLIFNTTYKVQKTLIDTWLNWIFQQHIPFMLGSGNFSTSQVAKVIGSEDEEGTSYSVQFHIVDMDALMHWHKNNASIFQKNCAAEFGNQVSFFTTVLEIIDK